MWKCPAGRAGLTTAGHPCQRPLHWSWRTEQLVLLPWNKKHALKELKTYHSRGWWWFSMSCCFSDSSMLSVNPPQMLTVVRLRELCQLLSVIWQRWSQQEPMTGCWTEHSSYQNSIISGKVKFIGAEWHYFQFWQRLKRTKHSNDIKIYKVGTRRKIWNYTIVRHLCEFLTLEIHKIDRPGITWTSTTVIHVSVLEKNTNQDFETFWENEIIKHNSHIFIKNTMAQFKAFS